MNYPIPHPLPKPAVLGRCKTCQVQTGGGDNSKKATPFCADLWSLLLTDGCLETPETKTVGLLLPKILRATIHSHFPAIICCMRHFCVIHWSLQIFLQHLKVLHLVSAQMLTLTNCKTLHLDLGSNWRKGECNPINQKTVLNVISTIHNTCCFSKFCNIYFPLPPNHWIKFWLWAEQNPAHFQTDSKQIKWLTAHEEYPYIWIPIFTNFYAGDC